MTSSSKTQPTIPAGHDNCEKGPILQVMLNRQESIFDKLDEINTTLRDVAVQKNEIEHINDRIDDLEVKVDRLQAAVNKMIEGEYERRRIASEEALIKQPQKTLGVRCRDTAILTCVAAFSAGAMAFVLYIIYDNIRGFVEFQKTQLSPAGIEQKHRPGG